MYRATLVLFLAGCASQATCPEPQPVAVATSAGTEEIEGPSLSAVRTDRSAPPELEANGRRRVPLDYAPSKGPHDAPVTIVIFSDFECPFCRRAQATLNQIEEHYANRVRFVFRQNPLPFHSGAMPAAIATMEAYAQGGDTLFWRLHDALFAQRGPLERQVLVRVGREAGLNVSALESALDDRRYESAIRSDIALARSLDARGTPNFFINGRQLSGAQPFDRFQEVIDEELATVDALRARGVSPGAVYATLTWAGNAPDTAAAPTAPTANPSRPQRRQPDPNAVYRVPVTPDLPQRGPDDALVTIVEIAEFECPFCARARATMDQIIQHYRSDVRIVWMNNPLPFHRNAMPAAELALEAYRQQGDRGFWALYEELFRNQRQLDRANLEQLASAQGLDMTEVRRALDTHRHQATIEAQQRLARSLGASGTPAFFVNGRNVRGAQPFAAFQRVIDEELNRARGRVQNGTPRRLIYEETIRNGATTPQFVTTGTPGNSPSAGNAPAAPDPVYNIPVPRNAPRRGRRSAPVVIQEFADFQCPFCARVQPTVDRIVQEYGNRVQIIWRDYPLPFHQQAHLAAEAAREVRRQAGDRSFWRYHELLFQNQRELSEEKLIEYAQQIRGVNIPRFRRALRNRRHQQAVDDDMQAVRDAGARIGTPSFFINGRLLQGAQPFEAFRDAIDRALNSP
ncbi:MAG: thioredoxin domain-containing protein [Myxococcota bacterium]